MQVVGYLCKPWQGIIVENTDGVYKSYLFISNIIDADGHINT